MNLIMGFASKYKKINYCIEELHLELISTESWINRVRIWIYHKITKKLSYTILTK